MPIAHGSHHRQSERPTSVFLMAGMHEFVPYNTMSGEIRPRIAGQLGRQLRWAVASQLIALCLSDLYCVHLITQTHL